MWDEAGEKRPLLTVADKIRIATELKDKGNELFKAGDYKAARASYARVFAYVNGLRDRNSLMKEYEDSLGRAPVSTDDEGEIGRLAVTANANLAMVALKLGDLGRAITYCDKVLKEEPEHVKALFRKGQAYMQLKDLDRAKKFLTSAAKLEPNNVAIRGELRKLTTLFKERSAEQQRIYGKAFGLGTFGQGRDRSSGGGGDGEEGDGCGCGNDHGDHHHYGHGHEAEADGGAIDECSDGNSGGDDGGVNGGVSGSGDGDGGDGSGDGGGGDGGGSSGMDAAENLADHEADGAAGGLVCM